MTRKASAIWEGDLKSGKGSIATESGALKQTQYSFSTRFENGVGTNPEELIAAAHAGCFSMALSAELGKAAITPQKIETSAALTMDKTDAGWTVTRIHLATTATIPDGAASVTLAVAPKVDSTSESDETVVATLGASANYDPGVSTIGTITLRDRNFAISNLMMLVLGMSPATSTPRPGMSSAAWRKFRLLKARFACNLVPLIPQERV